MRTPAKLYLFALLGLVLGTFVKGGSQSTEYLSRPSAQLLGLDLHAPAAASFRTTERPPLKTEDTAGHGKKNRFKSASDENADEKRLSRQASERNRDGKLDASRVERDEERARKAQEKLEARAEKQEKKKDFYDLVAKTLKSNGVNFENQAHGVTHYGLPPTGSVTGATLTLNPDQLHDLAMNNPIFLTNGQKIQLAQIRSTSPVPLRTIPLAPSQIVQIGEIQHQLRSSPHMNFKEPLYDDGKGWGAPLETPRSPLGNLDPLNIFHPFIAPVVDPLIPVAKDLKDKGFFGGGGPGVQGRRASKHVGVAD